MKHLHAILRSRSRVSIMDPVTAAFLRFVGSAFLRPGRGPLSVLIYHRVPAKPDPMMPDEPCRSEFAAILDLLLRNFNVLSLADAIAALKTSSLPPRCVCITFDDGYADNAEQALPELASRGLPATFFIASDFLDGGCMWNDRIISAVRNNSGNVLDLRDMGLESYATDTPESRRRSLATIISRLKYLPDYERNDMVTRVQESAGVATPTRLMMTSAQVRSLVDAGMEVGAHTMSHPILTGLPIQNAEREISGGRARLEEITGNSIRFFAYPNGQPGRDYSVEHVNLVRRLGFEASVTTSWGAYRPDQDIHQVPRFTPWDQDQARFCLRLFRNAATRPNCLITS